MTKGVRSAVEALCLEFKHFHGLAAVAVRELGFGERASVLWVRGQGSSVSCFSRTFSHVLGCEGHRV